MASKFAVAGKQVRSEAWSLQSQTQLDLPVPKEMPTENNERLNSGRLLAQNVLWKLLGAAPRCWSRFSPSH